jgi:hypothetical protein
LISWNKTERKIMKTSELTYIGSFGVDSGQAMVGDPCYLDTWESKYDDFQDYPNHKGRYGYLGACEATLSNSYGELNNGSAVVFSTGYGDGVYPVYAEINEDGRVAKIVIDFIGDEDED